MRNIFVTLRSMLRFLSTIVFIIFSYSEGIIPHFDKFDKACASKNANIWKIATGNSQYLITPAHVAVYSKDDKWTFSDFLAEFRELEWMVPHSYICNPSPQSDICWAKFPSDQSDTGAIILEQESFTGARKVNIIFRQPYNSEGKWVGKHSTLGATETTLYKTPSVNGDDALQTGLVESIDVGFRGMSGALAVSPIGKCVGIFVKRGSLIALEKKCRTRTERDFNPIARLIRQFVGLDDISSDVKYLVDNGLTRNDLHELGVVFDARRGIFLPASIMKYLIGQENAMPIKQVIGMRAPNISPF